MLTPFPIHNEADYDRALDLIDRLWGAEPGSPEAAALDVMATLVEAYEKPRSGLPPADPRKLIAYKLRELGMSQRALGKKLGWSSGRVSEVIAGKRALTLAMVRDLAAALTIPAGLLVHDVNEREDGAVWVRVSSELAESAEAVAYAGEASLDAFVARLLGRALSSGSAPDLLRLESVVWVSDSEVCEVPARRPPLSLVCDNSAIAA